MLIYNGVPIDIVSKLLGHSSMKITQDSYGKIIQRKISEEMRSDDLCVSVDLYKNLLIITFMMNVIL